MGSPVTSKAIPKDADVLVTINGSMDLGELARAGRRLKGSAQAPRFVLLSVEGNACH
jgi:hypothetical protein